jgi:hypothetical protein
MYAKLYPSPTLSFISLLTAIRQRSTSNPSIGTTIPGTITQAALSKAPPNLALVSPARKSRISIENGIAGLDEVGAAGLPITPY